MQKKSRNDAKIQEIEKRVKSIHENKVSEAKEFIKSMFKLDYLPNCSFLLFVIREFESL